MKESNNAKLRKVLSRARLLIGRYTIEEAHGSETVTVRRSSWDALRRAIEESDDD